MLYHGFIKNIPVELENTNLLTDEGMTWEVLEDTDGLMVFDIVHIINHGLWDELSAAVHDASAE